MRSCWKYSHVYTKGETSSPLGHFLIHFPLQKQLSFEVREGPFYPCYCSSTPYVCIPNCRRVQIYVHEVSLCVIRIVMQFWWLPVTPLQGCPSVPSPLLVDTDVIVGFVTLLTAVVGSFWPASFRAHARVPSLAYASQVDYNKRVS